MKKFMNYLLLIFLDCLDLIQMRFKTKFGN
jgi:hypothetical protein